jgi:hypothetical protein
MEIWLICVSVAILGAGGRVGFEIKTYRAGPLMRVVRPPRICVASSDKN